MTGPLGNREFCFPRISMFPSTSSWETLRFSGNKIHCSPRDQSLSVYYWPIYGLQLTENSLNRTFWKWGLKDTNKGNWITRLLISIVSSLWGSILIQSNLRLRPPLLSDQFFKMPNVSQSNRYVYLSYATATTFRIFLCVLPPVSEHLTDNGAKIG